MVKSVKSVCLFHFLVWMLSRFKVYQRVKWKGLGLLLVKSHVEVLQGTIAIRT
ncbi:hypothetical protein AAFN85_13655 [Mucilaginibacter sp. CAU 1740]|uniref:hypothetical protein n=1 Tax=Mucilaginibacter sp. CAU 1740 TaxID=3140365 RepID=UPI00325AD887